MYRKEKEEVLKAFGTKEEGLTEGQRRKNREKYGKNKLVDDGKKSPLLIFLEQFKDFLVIILIISAVISGILRDMGSAAVILMVITINAILGTVQTLKAEQSLDSLKAMSSPEAKVLINGKVTVKPSEDVVAGDILVIEAGDYICGDGRLIENATLKCAESALTGESEPVEKADRVIEGEVPLGDRVNMVYSGSFATYGRGKAVITAVGMNTEMGKIATLLKNTKEKRTPLQISLDSFGKKLSVGILIICAIVFGVSMIRGEKPVDAFVFAVALAVAAIPEALSSIVTIVLSMGTQKLAKENAIIRKLQAVEGLGCVSVICSDKTGTLTRNKMTVKKLFFDNEITDAENAESCHARLMGYSVLCNDAIINGDKEIGDPTEMALLNLAEKYNLTAEELRKSYPREAEIPFDSDRKLMSTVHVLNGRSRMITKGAADVLLGRIKKILTKDGARDFTEEDARRVTEANRTFSDSGLRVLAICEKQTENCDVGKEDEKDYILIGLVAMQDPPREESKAAVAKCKSAGIKPVMITGDHLITASAIAREIGILDEKGKAVEGSEIEKLSDEELIDFVGDVSVYARVSPEHKIRIVNAWQQRGFVVAMTGDGVNDAPALKQADIGVAMGITGSEVAKDAASMVLTDDNFATIVKAVENGRNLYANIQKAIQFLLSGNLAGILTVMYASVMALPVPFKAVHLLFINLLTDSLPAIALGAEPHSSEVMKDKPGDKNRSVLTKNIILNIATDGIIIAAVTIIAFYLGLKENADVASTMAFSTLCLSRLLHGFSCKSDNAVLHSMRVFNNKPLIKSFGIGVLLLAVVLAVPAVAGIFKAEIISLTHHLTVAGLSIFGFLCVQLMKILKKTN